MMVCDDNQVIDGSGPSRQSRLLDQYCFRISSGYADLLACVFSGMQRTCGMYGHTTETEDIRKVYQKVRYVAG